MNTPSPEEIRTTSLAKERVLSVDAWVAAHLSDVWQSIKTQLERKATSWSKMDSGCTSPSKPESSHNHS